MKREHDDTDPQLQLNKRSKTDAKAERVGLNQFINHGFSPITGEFKSRMEDFMVTEICKNGAECLLKSFDIPDLPIEERNKDVQMVDLSEETVAGLNKVLSKEIPFFTIPAPVDKVERTSLHKSIGNFNDSLSTETTKDATNFNDSVVKVTIKSNNFFGTRDKRPGKNNQYLHFTLLKWNITTSDAVLRLCKTMNMKHRNLSYAGMKDKRGITAQRMCCRFLDPKRLLGINKPFFAANEVSADSVVYKSSYIMGDFEFSKDTLKLGDLSGNKFSIVLRECEETTQENLDKVKNLLLENGFMNYFGLQRFGNNGDTHEVGKHILKKDYQSAIERILTPNDNTKMDVRDALNHYTKSEDAQAAYNMLGYKNSTEGLILSSLAKEPNDYKKALKSLHYKQQTLYTHAYQSYVWNVMVSRRISSHGTAVLEGDLVYNDDGGVRRLTPEQVSSSHLSDIVLPMPGYDIQVPENCCKDYLSEILEQDGMSIEDFKGPLGREFNVSGCYRNVIFKPSEFTAEIIKYSDENEKLVSTNLDLVLGKSFEAKKEGSKTALLLRFTLPKSCYATMLLREIMRSDAI